MADVATEGPIEVLQLYMPISIVSPCKAFVAYITCIEGLSTK